MKVKTSITLSQDILNAINEMIDETGNRSSFIEYVLRKYFEEKAREIQNKKDGEILDKSADRLNKEASEVLLYQVEY